MQAAEKLRYEGGGRYGLQRVCENCDGRMKVGGKRPAKSDFCFDCYKRSGVFAFGLYGVSREGSFGPILPEVWLD